MCFVVFVRLMVSMFFYFKGEFSIYVFFVFEKRIVLGFDFIILFGFFFVIMW